MARTNSPAAIRLSLTPEVKAVLRRAKRRYPALSDPEILKVGLSRLVSDEDRANRIGEDEAELEALASQAVGEDYLRDPAEDIYHLGMGKKVDFGRES